MCLLRKTIQNAFGGTFARSHQKDGWDRDVWDGVAPISVFLFFLQRHVLPYVNLSRSSLQMNGLSRALKYLDVFSSSLRLSVTMDMLLLTTVVLFLVCLQLCFKRQLIFSYYGTVNIFKIFVWNQNLHCTDTVKYCVYLWIKGKRADILYDA